MSNVFIPRLMDKEQRNPQNTNAQAIVARWDDAQCCVRTIRYDQPKPEVDANRSVLIHKLWRRHLWLADLFLQYQLESRAIFYPGGHAADWLALRCRELTGRWVPVISTVEGLIGNTDVEKRYSQLAGHRVYCQHVSECGLSRWDYIFERSSNIVAISPFLARMTEARYGRSVATLPLGIDLGVFHARGRRVGSRARVISAGRVDAHKRPHVMLGLARLHPDVDFVWYGEGELRTSLIRQAADCGIFNLHFPGPISATNLADQLRAASVFVLPSMSEGVPKVTLEAAACGVSQVIFGFYESPSVIDGYNGFVVWDDDQLFARVGELLDDESRIHTMGQNGAEMALELWDWDVLAPMWRMIVCESFH